MKKFAEVAGRQLEWSQPSAFQMHYELRAGDDRVATLRFRSSFGSFATAESAEGCWTFKRVGFWATRVTIRECGSDAEIGTFRNNTWKGGGTLELPGGRSLLATTNVWQTKLAFQDEAGAALIQYKRSGVVHLSAIVEIEPVAASIPELPFIVALGWYVTVMMNMDSGAAGVAAGA